MNLICVHSEYTIEIITFIKHTLLYMRSTLAVARCLSLFVLPVPNKHAQLLCVSPMSVKGDVCGRGCLWEKGGGGGLFLVDKVDQF